MQLSILRHVAACGLNQTGQRGKITCVSAMRRLSASEAQGMDPQNRVLLEQSAVALTDAAACVGAGLGGTKTGVYVGCMYQEYMQVRKCCFTASLASHRNQFSC